MRPRIRLVVATALAALVGALLALAPGASAVGTLDQAQEQTGSLQSFGTTPGGQSFTAGRTGNLDQVDLFFGGSGTVEIRAASGGLPTGSALATASVPATPFSGAWVSIPIGPVFVTSGTQYTIVVGGSYVWGHTTGDPYPGGISSFFLGGQWQPFPAGDDLAFRTYVTAPVAARFRSASATWTKQGLLVRWRTASEVDVLGFNVYRAVDGKRLRLNQRLIPAANLPSGGAYSYRDRTARRGKSGRYWIQAVNLDGSRSWYGPARVARP